MNASYLKTNFVIAAGCAQWLLAQTEIGLGSKHLEIDGLNVCAGTMAMTTLARSDEWCEEILPDIPNHVTLSHIIPKLSWWDLRNLCAVSRGWRQALQTRQIYDARVRSHSTETFVIVDGCFRRDIRKLRSDPLGAMKKKYDMICLYSTREKICYDLPPIRHLGRGIPRSCQCVTLDGNLYVLGGAAGKKLHVGSKRVYRLDLAGHAKQWHRCSDMDEPRLKFGAGVIDGKIYVLGGTSRGIPVFGSEMYDPKVNAWYPIKPMPSLRFDHQVTRVGDKLFVHGGQFFSEGWLKSPDLLEHIRLASDCTEDACHSRHNADYIAISRALEIYDPIKDRWRSLGRDVESFLDCQYGILFTDEGKLHSLGTVKGIRVLDLDKKLAEPLHSLRRFTEWDWYLNYYFHPVAAVAADDDILMTGIYKSYLLDSADEDVELSLNWEHKNGSFLLHGKGFGFENKDIVWDWEQIGTTSYLEFVPSGLRSTSHCFAFTLPIMCPIRL